MPDEQQCCGAHHWPFCPSHSHVNSLTAGAGLSDLRRPHSKQQQQPPTKTAPLLCHTMRAAVTSSTTLSDMTAHSNQPWMRCFCGACQHIWKHGGVHAGAARCCHVAHSTYGHSSHKGLQHTAVGVPLGQPTEVGSAPSRHPAQQLTTHTWCLTAHRRPSDDHTT
jgi:hypothetical protein